MAQIRSASLSRFWDVFENIGPVGGHQLSAVNQRKSVLWLQNERTEPVLSQHLLGRDGLLSSRLIPEATEPDQRQRHMSKRRQISRSPHASPAGCGRNQVGSAKRSRRSKSRRGYPRIAKAQGVDLQVKHQPGNRLWNQLAQADGVAEKEVLLQLQQVIGGIRASEPEPRNRC
jgi:hypothetical protein